MQNKGLRGNRAKRRRSTRPEPAPTPKGWPDGDVLIEAVDANGLAKRLLQDMKPEVMRLVLQRIDTPTRKAALQSHNIPVAKVSLRAASEVVTMAAGEQRPAESTALGTLLSPASGLFNDAAFGGAQLTAMRLKLVDLALPLIAYNESVYQGLRTWNRWADDSFEDLALAVVIGQRYSHAAFAAAYLTVTYPDIAERYAQLREQYPDIPRPAERRLTAFNPLTRYLAARPDRKSPGDTAELRAILSEDARTRRAESEQARRERDEAQGDAPAQPAPVDAAAHAPAEPAATTEPKPEVADADVSPQRRTPALDASALPDVTEWAAIVTRSREVTEALLAGRRPDSAALAAVIGLTWRLDDMSTLLSRVLGERVRADRFDVDRALTKVLSDERLSNKLGPLPGVHRDVVNRLTELPASPDSAPAQPEPDDIDLSDLDAMLRSETGARLLAAAGVHDSEEPDATGPPAQSGQPEHPAELGGSEPVAAPAPQRPAAGSAELDAALRRLCAVATEARHPGGPLSEELARIVSMMDMNWLEQDASASLIASCAALPAALLDATCPAAATLLRLDVSQIDGFGKISAFRRAAIDFHRHGLSIHDASVRDLERANRQLDRVAERADEVLQGAQTRTLKYDKATKIYRDWLTPGGRLHELAQAVSQRKPASTIADLAEERRKVDAGRAVDDTAAEIFGGGKPRIVAGARKTLIDKYDEVLALADALAPQSLRTRRVREAVSADRSVEWKSEALARFRRLAAQERPGVEAELRDAAGRQLLPPDVVAAIRRAVQLAAEPEPEHGPELSPDSAAQRLRTQLDVAP